MNRSRTLMILLGALVVAGAFLVATGAAESSDGDTPAGQVLFVETYKCNMCHSVPAAAIESKTKSESMKGPDLGGKIEGDAEAVKAFIRKAGELDGKSHKKEFKGTDEELQAIVDWLGSLEAEQ